MEWSKIKNIIILVLVFLNVLLLALVTIREGKSAHSQEEARDGIIAFLEKNEIAFLPEKLPEQPAVSPLTVTRSRDHERAMAEALLGEARRDDMGGSVRVVYTGADGTAAFTSDGRFDFTLADGARTAVGDSLTRDGADCLALLGLQAVLVETRTDGAETCLEYLQSWEGIPLFSCPITLTYQGSALRRIEGIRLDGTAVPAAGELLDTPTVLLRFLAGMNDAGYVCSRIDGMTSGYLSSVSAARPVVQLSPVWRIDTDTGAYYVDALTGALSRAET